MSAVEITGRILFLSGDPLVMGAQLAGADLKLAEAGALRDDISTDYIVGNKINELSCG
jgi:3-isopropylmalate/(R)-2-methylmalate dehydratase large subunit